MATRSGARPAAARAILLVYPYVAVSLVLYALVAVQFGAGKMAGDAASALTRGVLDRPQVTLEKTLRERASDVDAVRAALEDGADPNGPIPPMGMPAGQLD